jgi:cysteinyl-tRNA synthetase, unknown class
MIDGSTHLWFGRCAALMLVVLVGFGLVTAAHAADPVVQGKKISTWGYQLQNDGIDVVVRSPYDLVVIDYERDPAIGGPFTPAEVAAMKKKPDGSRRFVIAYISIGEAESYRTYWTDRTWGDARNRTPLIEKENPEWPANFTVKFWEQEWQNVILNDADSYINRIMDAGFDGIYLDKIDIFEVYQNKTPPGTFASDLMVQFVKKISTVTKLRNKNFLTIAQNAEILLDDEIYRGAIDGIGKESLLYSEGLFNANNPYQEAERNDDASIAEGYRLIDKLTKDKKLVLVVEYIKKGAFIERAAADLGQKGYVAYFGPRDLASLAYTSAMVASNAPPGR